MQVYVKAGPVFPFSGAIDLSGKRVGINRGWRYGEVFDRARRAGLFESGEATDNLKKRITGRVDGMIADELSVVQILHQMGWGPEVNSIHLVFTKHTKQTHLLDRFNQARPTAGSSTRRCMGPKQTDSTRIQALPVLAASAQN